jgi:plastocyanin
MKPSALIAVPLLALTLAACGGSSSSSSSTSSSPSSSSTVSTPPTSTSTGGAAPTSGAVQVTMKSLAFSPSAVHVKVGQTVQWTNDDTPAHNVTYVSGPKFASSGTLNPGAKFSIKVTQPGVIHYFCSIHPFMKATIVVTK